MDKKKSNFLKIMLLIIKYIYIFNQFKEKIKEKNLNN